MKNVACGAHQRGGSAVPLTPWIVDNPDRRSAAAGRPDASRDAGRRPIRDRLQNAHLLRYAMIGTPRAIELSPARDNAALHGHTPHARIQGPKRTQPNKAGASNANGDAESWILAEWACTRTSMRPDMVSHPHVREAGTPHTPLHHGTATRAQPSPHLPLLFPKVRLGPQVVACPLPSTLPAAFATNEKASMAPRAPGDVYS